MRVLFGLWERLVPALSTTMRLSEQTQASRPTRIVGKRLCNVSSSWWFTEGQLRGMCWDTTGNGAPRATAGIGDAVAALRAVGQPESLAVEQNKATTPVGMFWDLDNVRPQKLGREDVLAYVEPLQDLASGVGQLQVFYAAANRQSMSHVSQEEKWRQQDVRERPEQFMGGFDPEVGISGYDAEHEVLRCGVCGAKAKTHEKLAKHFRSLHEREARKLAAFPGNKTNRKKMERLAKYKRAAVDVNFTGNIVRGAGKSKKQQKRAQASGGGGSTNLRLILKEAGITCVEVAYRKNAADAKLTELADKFLQNDLPGPSNGMVKAPASARALPRGILVLVSGDADFLPLIQRCRDSNVAVVLAHHDDVTASDSSVSKALYELSDAFLCIDTRHLTPISQQGAALARRFTGTPLGVIPTMPM